MGKGYGTFRSDTRHAGHPARGRSAFQKPPGDSMARGGHRVSVANPDGAIRAAHGIRLSLDVRGLDRLCENPELFLCRVRIRIRRVGEKSWKLRFCLWISSLAHDYLRGSVVRHPLLSANPSRSGVADRQGDGQTVG